jgi:hypothetical protein
MWLRTSVLFLALCSPTIFFAQVQVPAPPPQTAREAIVEMLTGDEKGLMKHLTVEAQEFLNKSESKQGATDFSLMIRGLQSQTSSGIQAFPAGSTFLVINEPAQHKKLEVHVDNDDLNGDQDVLELSFHSFSDGQEQQQDEFGYMSSHITVTLKKQQSVWRLSNIGIGMEFPLGDPEFLKKIFFHGREGKTTDTGTVAPIASADGKPEKAKVFDPASIVTILGLVERSYAGQHPETGFTCSLSDLVETGKGFGLDPQLGSGAYKGYKWSVSGCDNKPAGSFQIVAEPIVQGGGARAACIDATGNLRVMEDGRGNACFTSGKVDTLTRFDDSVMIGSGTDIHIDPDKPKQ